MFNISFIQILIVVSLLFLMFGDFKKLFNNFQRFKEYFVIKKTPKKVSNISTQEKRESNP
jgi:hypothetical protein